ncbi:MAG: LamG domain-containing protein [Verrucomicrobiota bacterium]
MKPLILPISTALACWMSATATAATISQYAFEEGTGTSATQSTGGGAPNGTLVGANTTWVAGIAPGSVSALNFGAGSRVEIAGSTIWHGLSGFSVSTWIKPSALSGATTTASSIFWMGTAGGSARMTLQLNDFGDLRTGGRRTGTELDFNTALVAGTNIGATNGSTNDPIQVGGLYHVAATADYSTGLLSLYLGGNLVASRTIASWGTGVSASDQSFIMRIGSNGSGGEQFQGIIDDVQLFNTALTPTEVAALAVPEPTAALLGGIGIMSLFGRRRRVG